MTKRKLEAIALSALLVLSAVAIAGLGTAAEVQRGGEEPTFDPGVGGTNEVVVTEDKPVVYRGEDNIDLVNENGTSVDASNLIGVSGDAEGIPLETPIPRDQQLGQYAFDGDSAQAGVTVQQPRVSDLELLNERGADVADSSIPEDEILLVRAEWNFPSAEDLDLTVFDANGNEITGDVLADAEALSDQQIEELTGPYANNTEAVSNPGQRGTGTEQVFLQGVGQFNQSVVGNDTFDDAYWAVDLSDQPAGQYVVTVEGWDDLDFGPASRTATIELTTETDVTLDVTDDEATRGQFVPFTIRGSTAGQTHFVAIEDDDFRNNQVDERVFRDVEDVVDRGGFDADDDGTAEFAWAEVLVDEDTGLGEGQLDTVYLDDTNVDLNVFESGVNISDVADTLGNPEDDDEIRIVEGELTIDQPTGTYIAGDEVDVSGTAAPGIEDVGIYVRDEGDWELADINEDGEFDEEDLVSVDADGEWEERDVVLSEASDILAIPGRYRFGVIEAEDARDQEGNVQETLTTSEFSAGASEQTSIIVTEPGLGGAPNATEPGLGGAPNESVAGAGASPQFQAQLQQPAAQQRPLVFLSYNGQVATDDGTVDVLGTAPGQDTVLAIMVDERGRVATEQITVDDDDVFEEDDIPLVTDQGRELNEGEIAAYVITVGRDNMAGDGVVPGQDDADLAALENYVQSLSGTGLTQEQVTERFIDETIEEAGSDDLFVEDSFRYTDGSTVIETVGPAEQNVTDDTAAVQPGETMVVRGLTNRKPDDNTISVDVTQGPSAEEFPGESTDEWNFTGIWSVEIDVPDTVESGTYTLEADDGDNTDIVQFEVVNETEEEPAENVTETPEENVTETPEENVTETPEENVTETPEENVTETPEENVTETPTENVTETPTENVTETPAENVTETPEENVTETPEENVTETPEENVTETPTENVTETPEENVTETPTENVTETPEENVTETPAAGEVNTLTVFPASDEPARYRFSITGEFEQTNLDPGDTIEEQTARGRVQAASDTYRFTGEITEFTSFGGPVRLELNGEPVDPDELGDGDDGNTTDGNTTSVASGPVP